MSGGGGLLTCGRWGEQQEVQQEQVEEHGSATGWSLLTETTAGQLQLVGHEQDWLLLLVREKESDIVREWQDDAVAKCCGFRSLMSTVYRYL